MAIRICIRGDTVATKCDFCGRKNAHVVMDSGAWICKRCMRKLGDLDEWDDRIKYMGRAETYEAIHSSADKRREEKAIRKLKNAPIWRTTVICLMVVTLSFLQTLIEWTNSDTRINIWMIATIASAFVMIVVPVYIIGKRKQKERLEKKHDAERLRQEDELTKRQEELKNQKEELAKQQNEFIKQREELNRRRMEFQRQVDQERNRRLNEEYARQKKAQEEEMRHWRSTDKMTGIQFEQYCAMELKQDHGFVRVEFTKTSGDYGGDLVAYHKDGSKWVIQCKRYSGHVGIDAVQEVLGAKVIYNADKMAVMTNSTLTASAKELANRSDVFVIENINGKMRID